MTKGNIELKELYEENRAWWDEKGPLHTESDFYNLQDVINGGDRLGEHEVREMGSVLGKTLVHLQCHLGTETIGWARRGAETSGLDFSEETLKQARKLAKASNVEVDYRLGNVYDAAKVFEGKRFERAYVNIGSLHYLHDIERWGKVVGSLLLPGGQLYVDEIHPISASLAETSPTFVRNYFDTTGKTYCEEGSYADISSPTIRNEHTVWDHTMGDIINAVIDGGMRIEFFNEREGGEYQQFQYQVQNDEGLWQNPSSYGVFPSMFSLKATKA